MACKSLALFVLTAFVLCLSGSQAVATDPECGKASGNGRTIKLTANSKRNGTGGWVDTFSARNEASNSSDDMDLEMIHRITECDGKRIVYIRGQTKDYSIANESMHFHRRCGKNIAILTGGLTIQKINLEDTVNGMAFTHRPMRNNEVLVVRLEKKDPKYSSGFGIGIMTRSPDDLDLESEMHRASYAWMYHHSHIYSNTKRVLSNYGKNIDELQVGDRVGVMINEYGTLHFFVNDVDQGPAASSIPLPVYGIVELWYSATKATIVEK